MNYALITGASKGIGKAIAEILAQKNKPLLLVARSRDLLENLANDLRVKYQLNVDWFSIDLAEPDAAKSIGEWCLKNNYTVDTLINNAGYGVSGVFESQDAKKYVDMMRVNMQVLVELCAWFIPMLKKSPQSYILNIASTAAYQAVPGLSVYAASKSFVLSFSRALAYELKGTSISVTTVSPGGTATDFAHRANLNKKAVKAGEKLNMTAEEVAKQAVKAMYGHKKEKITGFINQLGAFLVKLFPKSLAEGTAAGIYMEKSE